MRKKVFQNLVAVCLFALFCCFLWGSAFPCIKIGYTLLGIEGTGSILLFAGVRFFLAGLLVVAFGSVGAKRFLRPQRRSLPYVLLLALAQTFLQYLFFYIGLSRCTGVKSSIVNATNVFFAILLSCFLFRQEKFNLFKLFGCLIGLSGILFFNFDGLDFSVSFLGEGFILLSALSSAFSSCLIKRFSAKENAVTLSGYQFIVGGAGLCAAGVLLGGRVAAWNVSGVLLLLYLAFVSAAAYTLWGTLLSYNAPSSVASYGFFTQVFGVILSAWWLGEQLDLPLCLLSLALISVGVLLIHRTKERGKRLT